MKQLNNYISEKLYIDKNFKHKDEVNPINVIRNTFISHAKEIWGDACGFEPDEIRVEPYSTKSSKYDVLELYIERHIGISDLRRIALEAIEYLKILECPYSCEFNKNHNSHEDPVLTFTKK